jgi:hypothetical protein
MPMIIEAPNADRAVPTIPTRVALPRQIQTELFGGWGVRLGRNT